jgi:hypothetical protein
MSKWKISAPVLAAKDIATFCLQFVLLQSSKISIAGLYFAGLTAVNLLNAGYMLFFIIFVCFDNKSRANVLWSALVIYAELVVLLLAAWQVTWTLPLEGHTTALIGLKHYDRLWLGLAWNLVIMLFAVIQWRLVQVRIAALGVVSLCCS